MDKIVRLVGLYEKTWSKSNTFKEIFEDLADKAKFSNIVMGYSTDEINSIITDTKNILKAQ